MKRVLRALPGAGSRRAGGSSSRSAAVLALYVGYVAVPPIQAGHMIIKWGYYYILAVFSLFVFYAAEALALEARGVEGSGPAGPGLRRAPRSRPGTLVAVWSDSFRHKILYDEFVIQGTAYEMHATKQVSTILRAYNLWGTWLPIDFYLDKRPYFFPFLVSLLHDLTGYRVANMFALNVACAAALLGLLYWFARELAGRAPALLAVALMALLPLFGQNATGAGMDLHNLTMIALCACLGVLYLRVPTEDRLSLFVLGAVLLTQSRYESVIFVGPVACVVLAGWLRAGRAVLSWPAVLAPLLLVPYAWHSRVLASEPIFWQLQEGQTSAFGTDQHRRKLPGRHGLPLQHGAGSRELRVPVRARPLRSRLGSYGGRSPGAAAGRAPRSRPAVMVGGLPSARASPPISPSSSSTGGPSSTT